MLGFFDFQKVPSITRIVSQKKVRALSGSPLKNAPLVSTISNHLIFYPTPVNLNYLWSFGSLAGFALVVQIVTGLFLSMHYTPHVDYAFLSVEHIMRDVNHGWFIRYCHANGASMFFIVVYLHIFRNIYYKLYLKKWLWWSGLVIYILMMAAAFLGYVLPWGQMSFWGATVITNFFSAIPYIGTDIAYFIWGGFSVNNATLNRFYSLHYLLPFIIAALSIVHISILHVEGSSNPLGLESHNNLPFYPYFWLKDFFALLIFLDILSVFVFFYPNAMGHVSNYIPANPLVTPAHIVPEWYFLPFYAILRSIPSKLGGVICMGLAIVILFFLPVLDKPKHTATQFRYFYKTAYWFFISDVVLLTWLGGQDVVEPYITIGQIATVFYFSFFLFVIPITTKLDDLAFDGLLKK
jgi:ubiquinol-cytochrome c reductase cytochrome b subunit